MQYEYQKILDAKKQREKGLKLSLSSLDEKINEWEEDREELIRRQREILSQLRKKTGGQKRDSQKVFLARLKSIREKMSLCNNAVSDLRERRQKTREQLKSACQSRKLLEKHKEKLKARARERVEKHERKITENHAIYNYSTNRENR